MTTWPLSRIVVGTRVRKRLGDIAALAKSIETIGLLHPIVVRPDGQLVAGFRRLRAMERLGREESTVTVARDIDDEIAALTAERDENTCREDFSVSELHEIAAKLLKREKEAADERRIEGNKRGAATTNAKGRSVGADSAPSAKREPEEKSIDRVDELAPD